MSLSWESVFPLLRDLLHSKGFNNIACPMKRGFMGTPDRTLFGGSEFRQSKVLLAQNACTHTVRRSAAAQEGDRGCFYLLGDSFTEESPP